MPAPKAKAAAAKHKAAKPKSWIDQAISEQVKRGDTPPPVPIPPVEAAERLGDIPLLVVHGDADHYFPQEHPKAIHAAAERSGVRTDLWIEPGFGHAESAVSTDILDRIGAWAQASKVTSGPDDGECPARSSGSAQT